MTIPIIISLLSILISLGSVFFAWKANKKASATAQGALELELRQAIENAKSKIDTLGISMAPLTAIRDKGTPTDIERETLVTYSKILESATQTLLNVYEEACTKFIDKKLDRERFKRSYHIEIRNLVTDNNLKEHFDPNTSSYKAILKIYREWNDLEK